MIKTKLLLAILLALYILSGIAMAHPGHGPDDGIPAGMRTWTESAGVFQLEAAFVSANDGKVQLRKRDGKLIALPIDQLSDDDRHWIKNHPHALVDGQANEPVGGGRFAMTWQYLVLGFEHILPEGHDHILFVLGLFLLSPRLKPLLCQVTAFTVAHSITLVLSSYTIISLSAAIVEPLIALSIALVAIENVLTTELKPWRPLVVFAFGLLHGLGFAGALAETGLPNDEFLAALLAFNVGVELGQLAVIVLAFLSIGWFRNQPWYRSRIEIPLSCAIAAVGLYWTIQRIWF